MYLNLLQQAEKRYTEKRAEQRLLQQQLDAVVQIKAEAVKQLEVNEKVSMLLQKTSEYARLQAKTRIEEIVSTALRSVFETDYTFRIDIVTRAGRVELDYFLSSGGTEVQLNGSDYNTGGGVIDVVCLAIRLAILEIVGCKGSVMLDEVGKMVSIDYQPNLAEFLKTYSREFDKQLIMVTHQERVAEVADNTIRVTQKGGVSHCC